MITSGELPPEFPVFVRRGDALQEIDEVVRALGISAADAGLQKSIFVARANQTVALVTNRECPLATELRRLGWSEPLDSSGTRAD